MKHLFKKYNLAFGSLTERQRREVVTVFRAANVDDNFRYLFMTRFPDAKTVCEAIFLNSRRAVTLLDRVKEKIFAPSNESLPILALPAALYGTGALITLIATVLKGIQGIDHHTYLVAAQGLGAMLFVIGVGIRVGMWLAAKSII